MALTYFKPLPGRFGVALNTEIGQYPATIANTATTTIGIGNAYGPQYFNRASIAAFVLPTSASACTVQIFKWDSINSAAVALTATQDVLVTSQTAKVAFPIAAIATLTDAQRTLHSGDYLYAQFVAAGTMTGQATGGVVACELYALA